ncbi:hypothetical protein ACF0H5_012030 [Mactra antiquata]
MDVTLLKWSLLVLKVFLPITVTAGQQKKLQSISIPSAASNSGELPLPDFDSGWFPLISQHRSYSITNIPHNLGEVPLLVDVRVKVLDGPNKGYIFKATGGVPRDDDENTKYGGVVYIYNDKSFIISSPNAYNALQKVGSAVYTEQGPYYTGPNQQISHSVAVNARAWLAKTLPPPDFKRSVSVKAGNLSLPSENYIEEEHGLNEYPPMVIARLKFTSYETWMSECVGGNFITYTHGGNPPNSYIVYGFNNKMIRVWVDSMFNAFLFVGNDGYQYRPSTKYGTVEMFAWARKSFTPPYMSMVSKLGPGVLNEQLEQTHQTMSTNSFTRAWVRPDTGPNAGFMFEGRGSMASSPYHRDDVCTYGGLVYAYNEHMIRFWRPSDSYNGGLVCVSKGFGYGVNSQLSLDADVLVASWLLPDVFMKYPADFTNIKETCRKTSLP